jgi:hypothetical protein
MATMGITTAIAIVPPLERPPELEDPEPEALRAEAEEEDEEELVVGVLMAAVEAGGAVDVIITTEGGLVPPVDAGDCVTVDVTATTDGCVGEAGTNVVEGVSNTEDTDTIEEVVLSEVSVDVTESDVLVEVVVTTEVDVAAATTLVSVTSITLAMIF